jgi:Fe2+ or Zn2+ uptake regulation protein
VLDAPASRDDAVVQAIYGVLSACTDSGLLRRIEPAGHPARFERRAGHNHHHLVCRGCGRTGDVDRVAGEWSYLEPVDEHGCVIDEAKSVFWGLCPACQEAGGSTAGRHVHEEEWQ